MENSKTCQAWRHDGSPCGRTLYDDEHCIFHSEDIDRKKNEFDEAFWKEFARQEKEDEVFDFNWFVFPGDISFKYRMFEKDVNFCGVSFSGKVGFARAKFSGATGFFYTKFFEAADFSEANFSGATLFSRAEFSGKADFFGAKFSEKGSFFEAEFFGDVNFSGAEFFGEAIFYQAKFSEEANLDNSHFENVVGLFETLQYERKYFWFFEKTKYKFDDFKFFLGDKSAARYPVINRKAKDAWYLDDYKRQHPNIYRVWKISSDCGQKITWWAGWSLGIAVIFALIYMAFGSGAFEARHYTWFSYFYYSIVTFTTLGFGDITPIKWYSEIFVTLEVILGYLMLGGLISIFATKLARRS